MAGEHADNLARLDVPEKCSRAAASQNVVPTRRVCRALEIAQAILLLRQGDGGLGEGRGAKGEGQNKKAEESSESA